jgi:FMN phosphatase YigB (HAD superfamily)
LRWQQGADKKKECFMNEQAEKIAVIDGDGVLWNNTRRMQIAEEVARATTRMKQKPTNPAKDYYRQVELDIAAAELGLPPDDELPLDDDYAEYDDGRAYSREQVQTYYKIFWHIAFLPDLVMLDTPLPDVAEYVREIVKAGYQPWLLTSNPEPTHQARLRWLRRYHLDLLICRIGEGGKLITNLITKPEKEQFKKTAQWKAEELEQLIPQTNARTVLVVEDEPRNIEAIAQLALSYKDKNIAIRITESLEEAVILSRS